METSVVVVANKVPKKVFNGKTLPKVQTQVSLRMANVKL